MASPASWSQVGVLGAELSGRPWAGRPVRAITPDPTVLDVIADGVPATLALPGWKLPRPALVFVNGVTARGRAHPLVQRLAVAAARAGFVAIIPDPPGLATGELTQATVEGVVAASVWLCERPETKGGRAGLTGVSLGTTVALLAAERRELAGCVSVVAGLAPFTSLPNAIRAATTGRFLDRGRPVAYSSSTFLTLVVGRSVVANLLDDADRARLRPRLLVVSDDDPDPLAPLREVDRATVAEETRLALALLLNRDPSRFDELYAALPEPLLAEIRQLSPIEGVDGLSGIPIEIASAPRDTYFPLCETQALLDRLPTCRLTVTAALSHAIPAVRVDVVREVQSFAAFLARVLDLVTAGAEPSSR
jgi:hypothetical protein